MRNQLLQIIKERDSMHKCSFLKLLCISFFFISLGHKGLSGRPGSMGTFWMFRHIIYFNYNIIKQSCYLFSIKGIAGLTGSKGDIGSVIFTFDSYQVNNTGEPGQPGYPGIDGRKGMSG